MELTMEHPEEETRWLLTEYYRLNVEPFLSAMSKDCCWVLPTNHVVVGKRAARVLFQNGFEMPVFRVRDVQTWALDTDSENHRTVCLIYTAESDPGDGMIMAGRQRATFCYRKESETWKLYHIHVSMEWEHVPEGEVFPVELSRATYRYVQELLKQARNCGTQKIILKDESSTTLVDPNLILYAEAADKSTVLHMVDQTLVLHRPIKNLERELPENFVRIHRSYLANVSYVVRVERFSLILASEISLPIPEKRYTQVRELVLRRAAWQTNCLDRERAISSPEK